MRHASVLVLLLIPRILLGAPGQEEEKQIKEKAAYLDKSLKSAKTPQAAGAVAEEYLTLSQEAFRIDAYELAIKLTGDADKIAKASKNVGLTGRTQVRLVELKTIKTEYDKVKEKLKTDPTIAGRFYCFTKDDWDAGLPHFIKADVGFRKFAERDLVGTSLPAEMAELGDVWWEIAGSNKGLEKEHLKARAVLWYQKAWPMMDAVSKATTRPKFIEVFKNPRATPKNTITSPPEWGFNKGTTLTDLYVKSGTAAVQIVSNPMATNVWETFRCKFPAVRAGQTYTFSCWMMTPQTDGVVTVSISQLNGGANVFGTNDTPYWYKLSAPFKATLDGEFALVMAVGIRSGTVYLDDLSLRDEKGGEILENGGFENR